MDRIRVLVIPTGGPQSGPQWRNLFKQIPRLRYAALGMTRTTKIMLRSEFYVIKPLF